jgi:TolB-like protein
VSTDRPERRLTAILAARVAGYAELVHADPEHVLAAVRAHRRELVDPAIALHRGRLVKAEPDASLVAFASAVDAVNCALAIQSGMASRNAGVSRERWLLLRIGVNVGDIIIEGDDILGDGVNVAARLESIAEPGTILASARVVEDARGVCDASFAELGERQLKNIARPVRVFRVGSGPRAREAPARLALPDKPSIAVLPFQNMSGDPEQDYFADGMVEDIITALSRYRWLFVIARNSSFTYKGRAVDVKEVGRELGVRFVLEGSVRKVATRVRITTQLIDATNGMHLWADHFDGALVDVFELQDEVTARVAGQLAQTVERAEIERVKLARTESLDAYDCYLRAMSLLHQYTKETLTEARNYLRRAIALDPDYAAAYGMAALIHVPLMVNGWLDDPAELAEGARLARRGAELGKDDAVAFYSAGAALVLLAHEVADGADFIGKALVLNPNLAPAWMFNSWVEVCLGAHERAIEHGRNAMRLSPLDPLTYVACGAIGAACLFLERYDEAASFAERSAREQARFAPAWRIAAASHFLAGRTEEAQRALARVFALDPEFRLATLHKLPLRRPKDRAVWEGAFRGMGVAD